MLRVVHVMKTAREGGAESVVHSLCKALPTLGIDATIVTVYGANLDADASATFEVPLLQIGRRSRKDVTFLPRLIRTIRMLKPDVVHAHIHAGKYVGRIAALLAGVPAIVFTEHGDEVDDPIRRLIRRALNRVTARVIVFS
jgi:glycosyltransferase involved in cell wall biosynthesis